MDTPVNGLRAEILAHVRAKATMPPGVFTLTVPTGGDSVFIEALWELSHSRPPAVATPAGLNKETKRL